MTPTLSSSIVLVIVILFSVNAQNDFKQILLTICEGNTKDLEIKIWPGTECQLYVSCYKGMAMWPQNCPSGLIMNAEKQMCDRPGEVECMDTVPRTIFEDCTRRAIRGACNNYTECDGNGGRIMKNCGENTVFSNELTVCIREINLSEDEKTYCNTQTFV